MTIRKLRNKTRMTQKEFGEYLNIPQRTIENWEGGQRKPAEYIVELIKYKIEKERLGMLRLIETDHGVTTELFEGTLEEVVEYLKENEDLYNWILNEDAEAEQPELKNIETLRDLEYELKKIDHDWWTLEVK